MATVDAPTTGGDTGELAGFGYKQELRPFARKFSSFAAGFSYISILTGVFQLFGFGFLNAGPAVWWTWIIVFAGQLLWRSASPSSPGSTRSPARSTTGRSG